MKRNLLLVSLAAIVAAGCTGCMNFMVPKTTITGTVNGQPFSLSSPKDSKLKGLSITSQTGGLTNYVQIKVEEVEATMNPAVITTTGEAQVQLLQAGGQLVLEGMSKAKP